MRSTKPCSRCYSIDEYASILYNIIFQYARSRSKVTYELLVKRNGYYKEYPQEFYDAVVKSYIKFENTSPKATTTKFIMELYKKY